MSIINHESPNHLIKQLHFQLPASIALLRRLENLRPTPSSLILSTPEAETWAAAYIDLSRRGTSQAWVFCSSSGAIDNLISLFRFAIENSPASDTDGLDKICLAAVPSYITEELQKKELVTRSTRWIKYLFTPSERKLHPTSLPSGFQYGPMVTDEHFQMAVDTTSIPRQVETLKQRPHAAIFYHRAEEEEVKEMLVAWAFIDLDGSLSTLYVLPEFRGKKLGKAVAQKLMGDMGEGWLGHTDVAGPNMESRGLVQKLGGKEWKEVDWVWIRADGL